VGAGCQEVKRRGGGGSEGMGADFGNLLRSVSGDRGRPAKAVGTGKEENRKRKTAMP